MEMQKYKRKREHTFSIIYWDIKFNSKDLIDLAAWCNDGILTISHGGMSLKVNNPKEEVLYCYPGDYIVYNHDQGNYHRYNTIEEINRIYIPIKE